MPDERRIRLRVQYEKKGRLAYLGHLEVLHTIDRSIRRSGLPFAVGAGFARRMKVQFCQAMPVGTASKAEYYDLQLRQVVAEGDALDALVASTPADLVPVRAAYVRGDLPALEAWLDRQSWRATVEGAVDSRALDEEISRLREERTLHFMRGDKPRTVDLAETLVSVSAHPTGVGACELRLETRSSPQGALRPQILLDAALKRSGANEAFVRVTRLSQAHEQGAALVEPFDASLLCALT